MKLDIKVLLYAVEPVRGGAIYFINDANPAAAESQQHPHHADSR
jgi:hypothetical protein